MTILFLLILSLSYARKSRVAKLFTPLTIEPPHSVSENPAQRGLLNSTELTAYSILDNCQTTMNIPIRNFNNKLMGFVTPWNKRGYQVAIDYKQKFDVLVPAWYRFVFIQSHPISIQFYVVYRLD